MDKEIDGDGVLLLLCALVKRADQDAAGVTTGCTSRDEREAAQLDAVEWLEELRVGYCALSASPVY